MNSEKCPSCGAPLQAYATECSFCGDPIVRDAVPTGLWNKVESALPPPSAHHPMRSDYVLGMVDDFGDYQTYYSVYYDGSTKTWKNDYYAGKIEVAPKVTHWMPLPAIDDPNWNSVHVQKPTKPYLDPNLDEPMYTKHVLICDRGGDYKKSIYTAQYSLDTDLDFWYAYFAEQDMNDPNFGDIDVTHWMTMPEPPAQ